MSTTKETITLYFKEGSSDKFYTISIEEEGGKYNVPFVFGRRGTTGQSGAKCSGVDYVKAKKAYDQVVNEKQAKGYTEGAGLKPYAGTPKAKVATSIHCQLLTEVDEKEIEDFISLPALVMQEKYNGKRMIIVAKDGTIKAINRKGLECGFPSEVEFDIRALTLTHPKGFVLDGECVGTTFNIFDALEFDGKDMRGEYVETRLKWLASNLSAIIAANKLKAVKVVPTAWTQTEKKALYDAVKVANGEGVVLKERAATYRAGRTETWMKVKFWATASFLVTKVNDKRSVALGLLDDSDTSNVVAVGNCTIPAGHPIPKQDDIIEVRYLYAHKGGSVYQPQYEGVRDDLSVDACLMSQLKYKPDDGAENDDEA